MLSSSRISAVISIASATSSAELNTKPFLVMQSSGGVASPDQVMRKPITTALSGPGRRRARLGGDRRNRRLSRSGDARWRRHLDRPLPDRSRQAEDHQWRPCRPLPGPHPDARRAHHRHRRRLGRLDFARRQIARRPEKRRRRAGTDVLPERRQRADAHRRQSRARANPAGADRRRHPARYRARAPRIDDARGAAPRQAARPSSWRPALSKSPIGTTPTPFVSSPYSVASIRPASRCWRSAAPGRHNRRR